jgi:SAM-dependent methyltransferase
VRRRADLEARQANHDLYETGAEVAEYVRDPYHALRLGIAQRRLAEHVRTSARGAVVLELGSSGLPLPRLLDGFLVVRSDIERAALATGSPAICLDAAAHLPIATGSVHGILMGELIEHIYGTRRLLAECHRVLRPAGTLVLTTPNLAGLQDRVAFLAGRSPRQVDPLHPYLSAHIRPFTARRLVEVLDACGFATRRIESNYVVWRLGARREVRSRTLARIAPGLGGSLICTAVRKP